MSKDKEDLVNKIIDLCLYHEIEETNLYLKILDNKIKFYQNEINFLEDTKPFFFQKKKLQEHNKKIEEYEQKIYDAYKEIAEEVDFIVEIRKNIDNN